MIKIALTGVAGVGKGLVADLINEECDNILIKGSFAYPIKEFLRLLCGMTDEHLYGELKEVPLTFLVTPDSLNAAAAFYYKYGIDDIVSFDRMGEQLLEVLDNNIIEGETTVIHGLSSRRLQQLFGTEIMRFYVDDVWVKLALARGIDIIDDLRFLNEAKTLEKEGYKIVRITGKATRIADASAKAHASEQEIGLIRSDYEINNYFTEYNSESKESLRKIVKEMLLKLYP